MKSEKQPDENKCFDNSFCYRQKPSQSTAVGGNLKKQLTTKNIQENEAISNCKIE
jgi:hypothetical protein